MFTRRIVLTGYLLTAVGLSAGYSAETKEYAVQVSATIQESPSQITLVWPTNTATSYDVYRRGYDAGGPWYELATNLSAASTGYVDTNVVSGNLYEYKVVKQGTPQGHGYLCSGIRTPLIENRGRIILLVEDTYAGSLSNELLRLHLDLIGDGWSVLRHDISPSASVSSVKTTILTDYLNDPANTKALLLFGRIPVPYSGELSPDGHADHHGAWPADVFYADMDGLWTDVSVSNTNASAMRHHNVPGDGKFDQTQTTGVELQVGRVDLSNMPAFTTNTVDLLRQYLDKNHAFRHGLAPTTRRALIDDEFGEFGGEAFAASGWRAGAALFGATNTVELNYITTLYTNSYLLAYGCGGGTYTSCGGVANTESFASEDPKAVFNMLFGSYFGDWDVQDNLLRAPLCTSRGLVSVWAGRPHWYAHPLAIGRTIGEVTKLNQNNSGSDYTPTGFNGQDVHIALMGDPTLRLDPITPASNIVSISTGGFVSISWDASPDPGVAGYHLYRSSSPTGSFTRLNSPLITDTNYTDNAPLSGDNIYMVRAIELESGSSGSYTNASQGVMHAHVRNYDDWRFNYLRYSGSDGNADADPDMDGMDNASEFHFATDPNNPSHSYRAPTVVNVISNSPSLEYTRSHLVADSNITCFVSDDLSLPWITATEGVHYDVIHHITNADLSVESRLLFYPPTNGVLYIRTDVVR